ncbi:MULTISPECIES: Rv2629 family ribosome hibernation factor [Gordonia]|uniref:Rv2629 family ribosome hibernation factor n=1 Tax=Gordonia TaxID=2053 RepID=UPI0013315340|nr:MULTISPECIES: hypothetical protein [Gordonia]KAF0968203.1 hypothetical protein BPODLACK_03404 [Gordonia sp. YY1]UPW12317.1 hypothetical protein M0655_13060 [Gordonia amicalis]
MNSTRLRALTTTTGPFASVYIDDSHNTEDAAHAMELRWRALRDELISAGAEPAVVDPIGTALLGQVPSVGVSGRAVIAGPDGVILDEQLIRPPVTPTARYSPVPYLVPLIEHGTASPCHVVAAVDHTGADIEVFATGGVSVKTETVEGEGYPVHHAASAESPGYGDPQQRSDEERRKNIRAVAERLTAIVDADDPEIVFVIGETSSTADLTAAAPERLATRLVDLHLGARRGGVADADVRRAVAEEFARRQNELIADVAERFEAGLGHDPALAVEGLTAVCGALRNGEVETLIIGDLDGATVVDGGPDAGGVATLAPTPENLSELGLAPERTLLADEALPLAAVMIGAELVRVDERIAPRDGVGAVLRYSPRSPALG